MKARSLSPTESLVILALEAQARVTVTIQEIARLAQTTPGGARKLAHSLLKKGWLQPVGRGRYIVNPPASGPDPIPDMNPYRVGSHLVPTYYFAYATAANLHGFLTQTPRAYTIATPLTVERSIHEPAEFRLVHVTPHKFFGWQETQRYGATFRISDPEKTIIDCLDRQDLASGISGVAQILYNAKPRLDYGRLKDYVQRMDTRSLAQRLGYLLGHVRGEHSAPDDFLEWLQTYRGGSFIRLASVAQHGGKGRYESRWRVVVNVPDHLLMGEVQGS